MGRQPGGLPTPESVVKMKLWLLNQGYQLESIQPLHHVDMEKYFLAGSDRTYDDLKIEMLESYGPHLQRWFDTDYTEEAYTRDMVYRRQVYDIFVDAESAGLYSKCKRDLSLPDLEDLSAEGCVITQLKAASTTNPHAVVFEKIHAFKDRTYVSFFNPDPEHSKLDARRCITLGEIFDLNAGITIIRAPKN